MDGYQQGGGGVRMGEKVQGIRSINGRYKTDGEIKNSMGNGEGKKLIYTTHGHELRGKHVSGRRVQGKGE